MRGRQPVANAVVPVDAKTVSRWQAPATGAAQPAVVPVAPPERRIRVVSTPGGAVPATAVPAAPGAVRNTPWTAPGRVGAARGDGGEANRAPGRESRPEARVERPVQPVQPSQPVQRAVPPRPNAAQAVPPLAQREGDDRRVRGRDDDDRSREIRSRDAQGERRSAPPAVMQPVPPTVQPVQPVQPVRPVAPQRVQPMPAPVRSEREDRGGRGEPRNERGDDRGRGGGGGEVNRERQNR
jgi:hypothetical protein